jgi:micrococcal nuclease
VARVTYAADGDTLDVEVPEANRAVTRVRLWGVDCPEIAHREKEQDAYFGREAADFVRQGIVGRMVRLELDPSQRARDRFGRLLAYVYLADSGEMLNELLIERGLGYADRRFEHVHKDRFGALEKAASQKKAGLWAGVKPEQMPAWRRRDGRRGS